MERCGGTQGLPYRGGCTRWPRVHKPYRKPRSCPGRQRRCAGRYDGGPAGLRPARCICTVPLPTVPLLRLASTECCRMISCPSWAGYLRKTTDKKKRGVSLSAGEIPLLTLHHIASTSAHFSSATGMPSSMFSLRLRCSPMPGQRTSRPGSAGSLDATSAAMRNRHQGSAGGERSTRAHTDSYVKKQMNIRTS